MPYSDYKVKDRKALAQLKYQIRRFKKQMIACGTSDENVEMIHDSLWKSLMLAGGSDDFYDDGSPLKSVHLKPCRCGSVDLRITEAEPIDARSYCASIECDSCESSYSTLYSMPTPSEAKDAVVSAWNCEEKEQ